MWNQTFSKELEDGTEIEIIVTFNYVDNGIGPYEYWGAKCVDKRMEVEFEDCKLKDGTDYEPTDKEVEYWLENAEAPEPDYPEPSDDPDDKFLA